MKKHFFAATISLFAGILCASAQTTPAAQWIAGGWQTLADAPSIEKQLTAFQIKQTEKDADSSDVYFAQDMGFLINIADSTVQYDADGSTYTVWLNADCSNLANVSEIMGRGGLLGTLQSNLQAGIEAEINSKHITAEQAAEITEKCTAKMDEAVHPFPAIEFLRRNNDGTIEMYVVYLCKMQEINETVTLFRSLCNNPVK